MEEGHDTLPLAMALRQWLPPTRAGGATNPATAWRWATRGARTPSGERTFLRLTRIGGRLFLERAAVEDFKRACSGTTPLTAAKAAMVAVPTAATSAEAVTVLRQAGILPADPAQARLDRPADKRRRARRGCRRG